MFIAALFALAKRQKKPKCPSTDKWPAETPGWRITSSGYWNLLLSYKEYYLAVKRNAIPAHATKCINLENIVLSQSQKAMVGFYLYGMSRIGKFIKTESKLELGVEGMVNRYGVFFYSIFLLVHYHCT